MTDNDTAAAKPFQSRSGGLRRSKYISRVGKTSAQGCAGKTPGHAPKEVSACKNYLSRVRLSVESPAQTSLEACNTRMKCVQRALCVVGLIAVVPCRAAEQARAGTLPLRSCALALIPALFLPSTAALRDSMWCLPTGFHFSLLHKLTRHFLTPP